MCIKNIHTYLHSLDFKAVVGGDRVGEGEVGEREGEGFVQCLGECLLGHSTQSTQRHQRVLNNTQTEGAHLGWGGGGGGGGRVVACLPLPPPS